MTFIAVYRNLISNLSINKFHCPQNADGVISESKEIKTF